MFVFVYSVDIENSENLDKFSVKRWYWPVWVSFKHTGVPNKLHILNHKPQVYFFRSTLHVFLLASNIFRNKERRFREN